MRIRQVNNFVLIKPRPHPKSAVVIPETIEAWKQQGIVVEAPEDSGFNVDDIVVIPAHGGFGFVVDGETYKAIRAEEILAVLEDVEEPKGRTVEIPLDA